MSPMPISTATAADAITRPLTDSKASALIFGPELYPHYVNWQVDVDNPEQQALYPTWQAWKKTVYAVQQEDIGGIPSPPVFKAFMSTPRIKEHLYGRDTTLSHIFTDVDDEEKDPSDLLTSRLCKHAIHPGNPCTSTEICPLCLMKQCLASLERIAHVWRMVGGPYRPGRNEAGLYIVDPEELMIYFATKKLWIAEKARWANLVGIYEQYAVGERAWEEDSRRDGSEVPGAVEAASSCIEALELAGQSPFVGEGWSEAFVPEKYSKKRGVGDKPRGSSVSSVELLCPPSERPETELKILRYSKGASDGAEEADDNTTDHYLKDHSDSPPADRAAARADSPTTSHRNTTSASSAIYTSSPLPPSSPPRSPSTQFIPSTPMIGVSFPDDLPSPSTRRSWCFNRTSQSYEQGKHASPYGSIKVDTSFARNATYDEFGIVAEEELETSSEAQDEPVQAAGKIGKERFAGFTDVDLDSEDDGRESDWSDDNDDGDGEDNLMTIMGRRTEGGKRLPGQTAEVKFRRPVFTFSWPGRGEVDEEGDTVSDTSSDEFDDDEVEEAMRDMQPEALYPPTTPSVNADKSMVGGRAENVDAVSLAEPDLQVTPRRRSHDEFVESEEVDEEDHVKRSRL
ncbi:hypothetical protein J4E91_000253 [Alternaria rosae]|nr:hypothetical protein J4E91_000253 [Alternaria rosae]